MLKPHDKVLQQTIINYVPKWVTPNLVTIIRLLCIPFLIFLIVQKNYAASLLVFLFVAITDLLDGALARLRKQTSKFGAVMDPVADKLLIGAVVVVLVFRYMNPAIGFFLILLEVIVIVMGIVWLSMGWFAPANNWGKIKMLLQVIATLLLFIALVLKGNQHVLMISSWLYILSLPFSLMSIIRLVV